MNNPTKLDIYELLQSYEESPYSQEFDAIGYRNCGRKPTLLSVG